MSKQFINAYKEFILREILYIHLTYVFGVLIFFILHHDITSIHLGIPFFGLLYLCITYEEICMVVKLIKFNKLNEVCNNHTV